MYNGWDDDMKYNYYCILVLYAPRIDVPNTVILYKCFALLQRMYSMYRLNLHLDIALINITPTYYNLQAGYK